MATVGIALVSASNVAESGLNSVLRVPDSATTMTATVASSAVSQQGALVVPDDGRHLLWEVTTDTGALWVAFGPSPTASPGTQFLVPLGTTRNWKAVPGDKVALIDAT